MSVGKVAGLVAAVSFGVIALFAAYLLVQLAKTMRIMNQFLDDVRVQTIPLITRFQTTMDHLNTELARVDGVLTALEGVAEKANSTTRVVQEVVTSPVVKVIGISAAAGRALNRWRSRKREHA